MAGSPAITTQALANNHPNVIASGYLAYASPHSRLARGPVALRKAFSGRRGPNRTLPDKDASPRTSARVT